MREAGACAAPFLSGRFRKVYALNALSATALLALASSRLSFRLEMVAFRMGLGLSQERVASHVERGFSDGRAIHTTAPGEPFTPYAMRREVEWLPIVGRL